MSLLDALPGEAEDDGLPRYRQKPRPIGFELTYTLDGTNLLVDSQRKLNTVLVGEIEQVRFTFKPGNIASTGFITRLRLKDGKTMSIGDISWRSMVEIERGGERYVNFIAALSEAIAKANPKAVFVAGKPPLAWLVFAAVAAGSVALMVFFTWRAFMQGATGAMGIGVLLSAIASWQMWPMVKLNRPMALRTGEVPAHLMPVVAGTAPGADPGVSAR
jgi:hypothetical protein